MVAAAKCMVAFQLGPNQGNKISAYEAQNLPDTGVFLLRGVRYNTWPMHGKVARLLADVPAMNPSIRHITPRPADETVSDTVSEGAGCTGHLCLQGLESVRIGSTYVYDLHAA